MEQSKKIYNVYIKLRKIRRILTTQSIWFLGPEKKE
jgi:hypothetical protein